MILNKNDEKIVERLKFCIDFADKEFSEANEVGKFELAKLLFKEGFGLTTLLDKELLSN